MQILLTHPFVLQDGEWWACSRPEAPFDPDWTAFWSRCRSCMIALDAAAHQGARGGCDLHTPDDPYGLLHSFETAADALAAA